jgi:four helix bundle protein
MATIRRFEELECWQEARKSVGLIYEITRNERFKKDYELVGQVKRSAVSVMANIAEGFHRTSKKDFMRFLDYSRASIAETLSHCYVVLDQGYIGHANIEKLRAHGDTVWKKVNNFIAYLSKSSGPKEGRFNQ